MTELNSAIDRRHHEVEAIETDARALEARILQIPGTSRFIPVRQYGKPVDPAEIAKNLTLRSLIAQHDPALASYLGIPSGQHRLDAEAAELLQAQQDSLRQETERLARINAAARYRREQASMQGLNVYTGRRLGS